MDLKADLRAQIIATLPHDPTDAKALTELGAMTLFDLLLRYHNWLARLVRPVPRSVHLSREFRANPRKTAHSVAIADICDAIQTGRDLAPRLSKLIRHGYVGGRETSWPDVDMAIDSSY
jgi:hypothetical protein